MCRLFLTAVLGAALTANAAEREFAFTWSSATLAEGHHDLEAWLTPRIGRTADDFVITELRLGLTTGLPLAFEHSLFLDLPFTSTYGGSSVDARVTTQWKWGPLKATDVLGIAGVVRASLGFDLAQLEARLVLDKRVGQVSLGATASAERSFFWSGRSGVDTRLEESFALRYALGAASFGIEFFLKSGFLRGEYQGTGLSVGPMLTVHTQTLAFAIGAVAQVAADKAAADKGNGQLLELRDNERFMLRLIVTHHVD